jgi:hypothetical protein
MQALDAVYKRGGSAALMCAECDHNKAADAARQWGGWEPGVFRYQGSASRPELSQLALKSNNVHGFVAAMRMRMVACLHCLVSTGWHASLISRRSPIIQIA